MAVVYEARDPALDRKVGMSGRPLQHRLRPGQPWPLGSVLPVAGQLLDALACVHAAGIAHRDIRPANVMLETAGRVEGAADRRQLGTVIGTTRYMAPRQLNGGAIGPPADMVAVGALYLAPITSAGKPPPGIAGVQLWSPPASTRGVSRLHALQGDSLLLGRGADERLIRAGRARSARRWRTRTGAASCTTWRAWCRAR